jgi:hypothetical protein
VRCWYILLINAAVSSSNSRKVKFFIILKHTNISWSSDVRPSDQTSPPICLNIPENFVFPEFEEDNVEISHQNWVAPHYSNILCDALNDSFPGQSRGRWALITCPLWSLYLKPHKFFLLSFVKNTCMGILSSWITLMNSNSGSLQLLKQDLCSCWHLHGLKYVIS